MTDRRAHRNGHESLDLPIEDLRREIQVLGSRIEALGSARLEPPATRHFRRFGPFYALLAAWILIVALVPLGGRDATGPATPLQASSGDSAAAALGPVPATDSGAHSAVGLPDDVAVSGGAGNRQPVAAGPTTAKKAARAVAGAVVGTGVTRGGFECKPGVRQLPWSSYAAQCLAKFQGVNGGATSRGVYPDKVVIATRTFPESANSQAVRTFSEAAGSAPQDVAREVRATFRNYFQQVYELYGRKVEFVEFQASSQSNSTDEAQSKGKEGACIDATKVADEIKAFAVTGASGPFGECLAERKVVAFGAGAYFPESWYRRYHPYLYNGVTECERIVYQQSEYMGKRMHGRKARWAGDPLLQQQVRKYGMYVPNNDEYQHCVEIFEKDFKQRYGGTLASRYNYTLDVSRFPDEAARGVVQFKAAGVTTVLNNCDPISTTVMTSAATGQNYFPEWYLPGVALQDVDSVARLYDAEQRKRKSIFGMSQLGDQSKLWGPNSEPGVTYKKITGKDIPAGTEGGYFENIRYFNFLQMAGPVLTPETLERGVHQVIPGGPPNFAVGYTSYQDAPDGTPGGLDHTAIDDSREIYWCDTCPSKVDGKAGAYLETYGGKRFRNDEWPTEEPPVYPPGFDKT